MVKNGSKRKKPLKVGWIHKTQYRKICAYLCVTAQQRGHDIQKLLPTDDTSHLDVIVSFGNTPVNILSHQTWLHIDGAYLGRPKYFRVTKNAFQPNNYIMDIDRPRIRWDVLNTKICPWRISGEVILICKVSERNEAFLGFNQNTDLDRALTAIRSKTDLPIVIREKSAKFTRPFEEDLKRAQSLVTWASTTSVQAVLQGVPIFLLHDSACNPVAGDINNINKPFLPERTQWAYNLAYQQWTRKEIRNGVVWEHFMEKQDG